MKLPNSATNLVKAIKRYCAEDQNDVRLSRAMADVIVGQMLPDGVVKGGSSLMFRYGGVITRYTKDIDTARVADLDVYLESLRSNLKAGDSTSILSTVGEAVKWANELIRKIDAED